MNLKYEFLSENCWYRNSCELSQGNKCNSSCIRFSQFKHLVMTSRLPNKLSYPIALEPAKCDLKAFYELQKIKDNIVEFVDNGRNLYIHSKFFGNGKTTWASKIMLKYFDSIWPSNGYRTRAIFIPVTEFFVELKQNLTLRNEDTYRLFEKIKTVDLVVWDDIGISGVTAMDLENFYSLLNYRISAGLSNIYTGNLNEKEIKDSLGPRLLSRIWNCSVRVEFLGEDRRNE